MTTFLRRTLRASLAIATLLTLAGCGGETIVQPTFGSKCRDGALRAGETVTGAFNAESCTVPYHFYSGNATPYQAYAVTLEKGKGYWFHLQQVADSAGRNGVDALLALWGRDAYGNSVPVAASDDEGEGINGRDSEFYFIAPRTGTYNLVAAAYDIDESYFGGYRLRMAECPVVATLDTAGTYEDLPMPTSDCVRHDMASDGYITRIVLVNVPADSFDRVDVRVESEDFEPLIEIGGPSFDVFANIHDETYFNYSAGSPAETEVYMSRVPGTLTLAIGSTAFDLAGRATITLSREQQALTSMLRSATAPATGFTFKSKMGRTPKR